MRLSIPTRRIAALTVLCLALTAQAASAESLPVQDHEMTRQPGSVTVRGTSFVVASPYGATCSPDMGDCTVSSSLTAIVRPTNGPIRLAQIGTSKLRLAAGETGQIITRLNAVGAAELRRAGAMRVRMSTLVVGGGPKPVPMPSDSDRTSSTRAIQYGADFSSVDVVRIPAVVLTHNSRARAVQLAPGQRLVLRFGGENASTGYAWKFDALPSSASLRRLSTRSIPARNCRRGTVGCFSTREVVYAGHAHQLTRPVTITAGLYGPQPMTDATVRFQLKVTLSEAPRLPLVVGPGKNGSTVTLHSGQPLVVQLPGGHPMFHTQWSVAADAAPDALRPFATQLGVNGGDVGDVAEMSFANPGSPGTVSLAYGAPGEAPTRTFRISTVTVAE